MRAFAWFTAAMTVLLLFAGAMVTSTGSGLSVPDWPLSFGQVLPEMQGGVFYEHGHRLIASGVGLLTLILAIGLARREERRWLCRLGLLALAAVVLQGVLGGLTVLYRLPLAVSVAHAVLAQLFLCLLVGMALALSETWKSPPPPVGLRRGGPWAWSMGLWGLIVLQLIVAAIMRHRGAGLAIPDFPLAHGKLIPDLGHPLVAIHYAHRVLALLITLYSAALGASVLRGYRGVAAVTGTTWALLALVAAQIALGAWTVLSFKHHLVASLHLATGALVLATATALTLLLWRLGDRPRDPSPPRWRAREILAFTRLRLNLLVLAATALGFFLGAQPPVAHAPVAHSIAGLFFWTLLGVGLAATASSILNQAQEAERDAAMARTRSRPIPAGLIGRGGAAALGLGLAVLGLGLLVWQANALTAGLTLATLAIYHLAYTPLKTRTTLNTIIGAVPGALPPVLGYTAARGALEAPALALFAIVFLWQIPHFLSIALRYQAEYAAAGFRMLPQVAESFARRQILLWGLALLPASLLPCLFGLAGRTYGMLALGLGLGFLAVMLPVVLLPVTCGLNATRVRALFVGSVVYLPALFLFLVLDRLGPW